MTQEEKQLLLKDLCGRLPNGVMVSAQYKDGDGWKTEDRKLLGIYEDGQVYLDGVYTNIENVKHYLRPMFSMTEKEQKEYDVFCCKPYLGIDETTASNFINWLNAHHFDYRGLIEKGLGIDCSDLNIY